eukprot:1119898-Pyramimonas_sp.AAC.1
MDLCDPPVTRMDRASESLDGRPVFTWKCITADLSARSPAAVSTGSWAAAAEAHELVRAVLAALRVIAASLCVEMRYVAEPP